VVSWESINGEDLGDLCDVGDLQFLQFEVGIEASVVELTHHTERISSRQVLLLHVIDGNFLVNVWAVFSSDGVWNFFKVLKILGVLELFNECRVLGAVL